MQDDQWDYPPKRGSTERPRPGGGNSGPLPGQRPGAARPSNATGSTYTGRAMGNPNNSGYGQPPMNNSWGQNPPQRRGPSGPINSGGPGGRASTSYPLSSGGPTRSGGLYTGGDTGRRSSAPGGRSGGWEDGQTWQGQGGTRTSRGLTPPTGRPALGGRGQTGQWGGNPRGWEPEEDEWDVPPPRTAAGKVAQNGRAAQGGRNQQPQARKGTTVRGNWVIETDTKYKAPGSSWRVRLLFLLLASVIALGAGVYFVPGAKDRLLAFLPGSKNPGTVPGGGGNGTLTLQVNAPSAKVTLDSKDYTTAAGQAANFSSVAISGVTPGKHNVTIQAENFTDFTGELEMPAGATTMTAWLAPTAEQLTEMAKQFKPASQPSAGTAGDHYNTTSTAPDTITVSISYTLTGLDPSPFASQLAQGSDIQNPPFEPAKLALTPVVTFKDAAGTKLYEYKPKTLATSLFALQMPLAYDDTGGWQFGTPSVVLPANVTTDFSGPAQTDYLLYFALASILPSASKALKFVCVGAVNKTTFNPEDGLFIVENKDDPTTAHYFYRWGILWATNDPAQTLTPKAPRALPDSNEFTNANTARANGSCGS